MAIYGQFHSEEFPNVVTIERMAKLEDIKRLDGRKPDKVDREAIKLGSYVVIKEGDGRNAGEERLYHIGRLRADGGWTEISLAIEAAKAAQSAVE